jgi:transposase-like protein
MSSLRPVTPEEALAVWSSIKNPSARSVARALSQTGRKVHHSTIARWCARDWRWVAHRRVKKNAPSKRGSD